MFNNEWALKSCFNQVQQNFGHLYKRAKLKKKKKKTGKVWWEINKQFFFKKIPEFKTLFLDLGVNPGYEQK